MKRTILAALTAAFFIPFPALAENYPAEIEIPGTLAAYICLYRTGYFITSDAAAEAAFKALRDKGYRDVQITTLMQRHKEHIISYTRDHCANQERKSRLKFL